MRLDLEASRVSRLVQRAREGDRDAFGDLYRLYHARIWRLARFRLPPSLAEDAVAETFLRAWSSLPRYRDTGAPWVSWLYAIARHVVVDLFRSAQRTEAHAEIPDRAVEDEGKDDRVALAAAIARLPDRHRQVIEMKFFLGLSNGEVARGLGSSPGAVNVMQWRALAKLRKELEQE